MKRLFLFFSLVVSLTSLNAQTKYVSSDTRQTCYWNATNQKFSECGNSEAFECMFTLNSDETMFVHTTKSIKSSYYVKNKTYSAENDIYIYDVMSDVGNKYQFMIGKASANFVILSTGHADTKDDYIMKFPIKKQWTD